MRSRRGRPLTPALPELADLPAALDGRCVVLDGELVAGDGRPDAFYAIAARMSARRPGDAARWAGQVPLTLVAFDVLHLDDQTVTREPYEQRRARLEDLALAGPRWCTIPSYRGSGPAVFDACDRLGIEGVVARRLRSWYWPGERSRDWTKVKTSAWRDGHGPRRHERVA